MNSNRYIHWINIFACFLLSLFFGKNRSVNGFNSFISDVCAKNIKIGTYAIELVICINIYINRNPIKSGVMNSYEWKGKNHVLFPHFHKSSTFFEKKKNFNSHNDAYWKINESELTFKMNDKHKHENSHFEKKKWEAIKKRSKSWTECKYVVPNSVKLSTCARIYNFLRCFRD